MMQVLAAPLAIFLAAAAPASDSTRFAAVAGWAIDDLRGACSTSTIYEGNTFFHIRYDFGENRVILTVADPAWESVEEGRKYGVQLKFANGDEWSDTGATGFRIDSKEARLTGLRMGLDGDEFLAAFGRSASLAITMGDRKLALLSLKGTGAVAARLRECAAISFKRYPADPFKDVKASSAASGPRNSTPSTVEPARSKADLHSLITQDDYPPSALKAQQQGTVRIRLGVGASGRVEKCEVTATSGYEVLDSTTCRLMTLRARFTPARDSSGNPTTDTVESQVTWSLIG
jgi:TonB family protein